MEDSWEKSLMEKEQEWKGLVQLRVRKLENDLLQSEKELKKEKVRFSKLKEDFEYNLTLIEERDRELDKYETVFNKIKENENKQVSEVSELSVRIDDLKMKLENEKQSKEQLQKHYQKRLKDYQSELSVRIDDLKMKLENEKQSKEQLQKHYQKRLKDYQSEMNVFRNQKENEITKEREELASCRRNLESQLRAAEDDYEYRRQEMVGNFDEEMRKREDEYQRKLDDTSNVVLTNELKIRALVKELELVRNVSGRDKEQLEQTECNSRALEKEIKEKEWIISDMKSTYNFKMADMQAQLDNVCEKHKKIQDDFTRKHGEQDRMIREREEMLTNAKQGFAEQERQLVEKMRELQTTLEMKEQEYRQKEWKLNDKLKEQELSIQNLQQSAIDYQCKKDAETAENARLMVAKDVELEGLQQQEGKLRSELVQRKDEITRFQKELSLSLERQACLERSKSQLELDWQRRCEDAERSGYEKQEELVKNLTQSKNEAYSLVDEMKREISHKDNFLRILTEQRDKAVNTLQRHGLSIPQQIPTKDNKDSPITWDDRRIKDLESQNEKLLQVIHMMRQDMETITSQQQQQQQHTNKEVTEQSTINDQPPLTTEYVESLEKEIRVLKAKNRDFNERLTKGGKDAVTKSKQVISNTDLYVVSHVKELNDTIGALRQEKLDLNSQLRKYEATIVHQQGLICRLEEQMRQKQTTVDKLQYELTTLGRRADEEMTQWKQRESELSLQLAQARNEADEFYKNSLERNVDAVALGNQLSSLKLNMVNQGNNMGLYNPHLNIIKQLEEEVNSLRSQTSKDVPAGKQPTLSGVKTRLLQEKLRDAVQRINVLLKEKEQLIKIGNKLRAEIMKLKKGEASSSIQPDATQAPAPTSKLKALEELQYQITAQELQLANNAVESCDRDVIEPTRDTHTSQAFPESSSPRDKAPWQPSISSDEHSSLKEVWKLLDEESLGMTPQVTRVEEEVSADISRSESSGNFTVKGRPVNIKQTTHAHKPSLSTKAAGKWTPAVRQKMKVRNYNIMKDSDVLTSVR